ncbi:MAG: hypothetical protein Q8S73_37890 [Deltaproteobacteria bacterium]|nr:hypothetical protein [Myxococcales bacterium]MDP3219934.1 hypothetical protein [Deltaproteobacteria bacterium]
MTTLAGHPLLSLSLVIPRTGAWTADVEVDTDEALTGVVDLALEGRVWRATVARGSVAFGRWSGRLVGAGALLAELAPLAQASTTLRGVLDEVLRETATTLAPGVGDLSATVARWHRSATTGAQELAEVALRAGMSWRVLADATVWVGPETWDAADVGADVEVLDRDPVLGRYELAGADALDIRPGTIVQLREGASDTFVRVGAVVHRLEGVALRTSVLEEQQETTAGRLWAAFVAVVLRITRRFDRTGSYAARVVAQNADGTLDLQPDDARRPSCQRVPYRTLPGLAVEIPAGARVSYTYEDGDPRRPLVTLWEPSTAAGKWTLYGGTHPAARQGHAVQVTIPAGAVHVTNPAIPAVPPTIPSPGPITLSGTITAGTATFLLP